MTNDKLMFIHTCFKGGFESSVSSSSVEITLEMYPDHVTRALNRTRLVGTTYGFGENWTIRSIKSYDRKGRLSRDGFSHLQVVIFTVCALFQFEYVKGKLYLASFRNN